MAKPRKASKPSRAAATGGRAAARGRAAGARRRATAAAPGAASRVSQASAASGGTVGALRSSAAVRGRRGGRTPLEAAATDSARRPARVRGASVARRKDEPEHALSPTAVAAEALRTGVVASSAERLPAAEAIPGPEAETILAGDPDDEPLRNEYVGEETPGGSTPTPDQSNVDDIGRVYGVQEEDSGELRTSTEVMEGRDRRRRGPDVRRRG